jgi:GT2 family glycosyltransferase
LTDIASHPLISFLTVNFNQPQVTVDLLNSLDKLKYKNWEVIVVDNGSERSNLRDEVQKNEKAQFLETGKNLGFAGGNNAGLPLCKGEYIFFINNDTEVEPDLLDKIVPFASSKPKLGMVSPRLHYYHDKDLIQYAGATPMSKVTIRNEGIGWKEKDEDQYSESRKTSYIHGAAMLVPKEVINAIGPMYEDYFLYYEEYDWCERIAQSGLEIWYFGGTKIFHKESVSTGQDSPLKIYYLTRNRLLFARRNYSSLSVLASFIYFGLVALPKNMISWMLKGRKDLAISFFKGYWWNITHKSQPR